MKKILATFIGLAAGITLIQAQGFLNLSSGTVFNITTNTGSYYDHATPGAGYGSVVSGKTPTSTANPLGYYYALLYIATGDAATGSDSNNLANGDWTQLAIDNSGSAGAALLMTNDPIAGNFQGDAGGQGQSSLGIGDQAFANGITYEIALVGWSSNLGSDWNTVESELSGNSWSGNGFFGYVIGTVNPAGAATGTSMTTIFGNSSLVLYSVPEPTTLALAGLGGMALLAFRRRKVS